MGWVSEDSEGYKHVWGKVENAVRMVIPKTPPSINKPAPANPGRTVKGPVPHSPLTVQGSGPVKTSPARKAPASKDRPTAVGETKPNTAEPDKVKVAPMWVMLGDADDTTYTLMADDDPVRLDLIKQESLDTVKPQPAAWLVADGKVAQLGAEEVKMLTGE